MPVHPKDALIGGPNRVRADSDVIVGFVIAAAT
jgi:hypothetical protein